MNTVNGKMFGRFSLSTIIIIIVLVFTFLVGELVTVESHFDHVKKRGNQYFAKYKLQFSGIVFDKECLGHDNGLYSIKLSKSNCRDHDLRNSKEEYYGVIKGDTAQIIEGFCTRIDVGDSISIDFNTVKFQIFRKGILELDKHITNILEGNKETAPLFFKTQTRSTL